LEREILVFDEKLHWKEGPNSPGTDVLHVDVGLNVLHVDECSQATGGQKRNLEKNLKFQAEMKGKLTVRVGFAQHYSVLGPGHLHLPAALLRPLLHVHLGLALRPPFHSRSSSQWLMYGSREQQLLQFGR
jgi:hypothetical protein